MQTCSFNIIATAVDKRALFNQYSSPHNPYNLALTYCMERTQKFLQEKEQIKKHTHIIIEARGKKEDRDLEQTFGEFLRKNADLTESILVN